MSFAVSSTRDQVNEPPETVPMSRESEATCLLADQRDAATFSLITYLLVCCFAMSSWMALWGMFVELPLLVQYLPEGWALPSYIVIVMQSANVGPIVYAVVRWRLRSRISENVAVGTIIFTGAGACLLLAFFWRETAVVFGRRHSVALVSLTWLLALVDCTSSVVYLPFMAVFPPRYMTAFYIGEGLSGLAPGLAGLAQGVGGKPTCVNKTTTTHDTLTELVPVFVKPSFSVSIFFVFLFVVVCLSGIAFICLKTLPRCKLEMSRKRHGSSVNTRDRPACMFAGSGTNHEPIMETPDVRRVYTEDADQPNGLCIQPDAHNTDDRTGDNMSDCGDDPCGVLVESPPLLSSQELFRVLALTTWINALAYGVLPALQSYTCLPYGYRTFNLAVKLSTIANPLACSICFFRRLESLASFGYLTTVGTILSAYLVYLAAESPTPPLQTRWTGQALVVSIWVILRESCQTEFPET